ncbi:MAG: CsbD family protein [Pseudomonas sp.]|uniref:CsbD family protein n=1 Tax=Pseudomonas abieticivorans TaxID=2931382 RepID=UPI0020BE52E2|nr:CsbD family protein [Pseudomonas sp. PIA16]MDE1166685.1 CsbD family protein [Pseudomonas sp.]
MRTEEIKGAVQKVAGKAQGALGDLTGDSQLQMEGQAREAAGQLQQSYGEVLDTVGDFVKRRPLASVAIGAGVLLVLRRLLRHS